MRFDPSPQTRDQFAVADFGGRRRVKRQFPIAADALAVVIGLVGNNRLIDLNGPRIL